LPSSLPPVFAVQESHPRCSGWLHIP
jgi:hypothetical protein